MTQSTVMQRIRRGDRFDAKTKSELLGYVGTLEAQQLSGIPCDLHQEISERLKHARKEHPINTEHESISAIFSEVEEFDEAILNESPERQRSELLDVVVTCLRRLNCEYSD